MKILLVVALVGGIGLGASAASAAPAHPPAQDGNSAIVLAQYNSRHTDNYRRHHRRESRRHYRRHHRYVPGRHYHSAPHGWHRYSRRPGNWRTRGCIVVGPMWFCP